MKIVTKLRVILVGVSILVWFFFPRTAGLIMLLLGISMVRSGVKSRPSTVATGLGVLMFSLGVAMMMTGNRLEVLTIGLSVCAVFLLRALFWEVQWIKRNLFYLIVLSFFLALLPVSEKFSALFSSLVVVLLVNSTISEGNAPDHRVLFENESVQTADIDESGLREFIEKGDKAKLITYLAYHSPGVIPREKLERMVRMILKYRDRRLLGPGNKRRRRRLVDEIVRMVEDEVSGWIR